MKVLIVENESEIVEFLKQGLSYENFKADAAYNGEEAIYKACSANYDIILLDLLLPKIDGLEVLKKIRSNNILTPIIAITVIQDNGTKVRLLNNGVDDYIEKPFSFNELVARMRAVIRRSRSKPVEELLKISDLELYTKKREVYRNHKKINLRNKEYELLEHLMRNKGFVVTRNTIMEQIWKYSSNVNSNTIDTHVTILRKKIDNNHKVKLIHTIHGVGYKIALEK